MYFIRFNVGSEEQKVLVRNKRNKENFNDYQEYITKAILNKMARVLVKQEEIENGFDYKSFEYRKRVAFYKKEYIDVANIYAKENLQNRYPDAFIENVEEEYIEDSVKEEKQNQEYNSYTVDELAYLMHKSNPKIDFWYDSRKDKKIYMDEEDLSKVTLPEGYFINDNNSIVDSVGNVIQVEDVSYSRKYTIKKSNKFTAFKLSLKKLVKPFSKKTKKIATDSRLSVCDELVENYVGPLEEKNSIHDEIVENFVEQLEKQNSIYDEMVENFDRDEKKHLSKYQEKVITDNDILAMNVYSNCAKDEVNEKKANEVFKEVLEDDAFVLTRNDAIMLNKEFNFDIKAFDVDLSNINYPKRQLDCGCGIIEIYGDEFSMLIESKYEVLKENEDEFKKLPKAQRESFDAYYKRELKNAFDYSNKGKVKLMETEYDKLLKIHNDYFKLCTIRREREHLLEIKNAYIEKQIQKLIEEIEADFEKSVESLLKAEVKYSNSLEEVKPVKVIKK